MKFNTKTLVMTAVLIAMQVALRRFGSIPTPITNISLGFVPIVISAMCFGPVNAMLSYAAADFIGAIVFPSGSYFPGFTLTAAVSGLIFGLYLRRKPESSASAVLLSFCAALTVAIVGTLGLNLFWLCQFFHFSIEALLPARLIQSAVMVPVQTVLTSLIWLKLYPLLIKNFFPEKAAAKK